jgi:hypothetical protein
LIALKFDITRSHTLLKCEKEKSISKKRGYIYGTKMNKRKGRDHMISLGVLVNPKPEILKFNIAY